MKARRVSSFDGREPESFKRMRRKLFFDRLQPVEVLAVRSLRHRAFAAGRAP
jgi:hypothetical protein